MLQAATVPSYTQLTHDFGPFLGLCIFFLFMIIGFQTYWFNKSYKAKDEEVKRSVIRITELEKMISKITNQEISNRTLKKK